LGSTAPIGWIVSRGIEADLADIIEVQVERIAHFVEQPLELPSRFLREYLPDDPFSLRPRPHEFYSPPLLRLSRGNFLS
jgi:hypothetical protein